MKNLLLFNIILFLFISLSLQINASEKKYNQFTKILSLEKADYIQVPSNLQKKILSRRLIELVSLKLKQLKHGELRLEESMTSVVLYFKDKPTESQKIILDNKGLECYWQNWTPPAYNHPFGFIIAKLPVKKFVDVLSLDIIKKIDTAERFAKPQNNNGAQNILATQVWDLGYDGSGIKVGVLDSGLDSFYMGTDLPSSYEAVDYSDFPNIDSDVENTVVGHGTHVTGSVLGRGNLSSNYSHQINGQGAFRGIAPGADLAFLKIGNDYDAYATWDAMIFAMDAAVNNYNVDVLSMSYGGWSTFHDGSEVVNQKADWVHDQGVPIFMSAGNRANDEKHYSGTVSANSSTDYIKLILDNPQNEAVYLNFNLVWYDGLGESNDLSLEYYDSNYVKLTDVTQDNFSYESFRGTESKWSHYNHSINQSGAYYLKVINNSSSDQFFHIYEHFQEYFVSFQDPDPYYTVGSPADADNVVAVGAHVTRERWMDYNGSIWWYSYTLGNIAPFSSGGPRVDGYQKPDITAPGSAIISLRDTDVPIEYSSLLIDNDGSPGGEANYYVDLGTSMACPMVAGAAALLLQKNSNLTPQQIYSTLKSNSNTANLGDIPNSIWGYGKLNVFEAITNLTTEVNDGESLVNVYELSQNYPNPFNPTTKIKFAIPSNVSYQSEGTEGGLATLVVYDILGREIKTLINQPMQAGNYELEFDGSNLPSGVYFYRLTAGEFTTSKKMILLK